MQKNTVIIALVVVVLIGLGMLVFRGGGAAPATESQAPAESSATPSAQEPVAAPAVSAEAPASATYTVTIKNMEYSSPTLTLRKGDTVAWTNADTAPHTVTGDKGVLDSGTLKLDEPYRYTFNEVGTFTYQCKFHPSMKGMVIVTE